MSSIIPSVVSTAFRARAGREGKGNAKHVNPLSYPKSTAPFSAELFKNPTSEYRGCPFWAWNNKLNREQLLRQIDNFKEMGLGGFHVRNAVKSQLHSLIPKQMHARVGLDTEYMGPEFMDMVRVCVDYAEKQDMLACLYDEDRWPSGYAGGKVVKGHPEYKAKHLLFTLRPYGSGPLPGSYVQFTSISHQVTDVPNNQRWQCVSQSHTQRERLSVGGI
jgi:hypothetical protein